MEGALVVTGWWMSHGHRVAVAEVIAEKGEDVWHVLVTCAFPFHRLGRRRS